MRRYGLQRTYPHARLAGPRSPLLACLVAAAAAAAGPPAALAQETSSTDGTADGDATTAPATEEPAAGDGSADSSTASGASLTIAADRARVRLGRRITLSGQREPALRGKVVKLKYKRPGGRLRKIARTETDGRGRYELSVRRRRSGYFVAISPRRTGRALRSGRAAVEVRARTRLRARNHQLRRRGIKVRGRVLAREGGRRVVLKWLTGKGWQRAGATRTDRDGGYRLRWRPPALGGYKLRARFGGDELNGPDRDTLRRRVRVYREDHASYYGPGLYGNRTACGQTLRRDTVGVAHRRIRCGAKVRFHYRGRTRRVPVIDRGPYVSGRRWDLTDAARRKLRFPGTGEIWANR